MSDSVRIDRIVVTSYASCEVHDVVQNEEKCLLLTDLSKGEPDCVSENGTKATNKMRHIRNKYRRRAFLPRSLKRYGCYSLSALFFFIVLYKYFPNIFMEGQKRHMSLPDWSSNTSLDIKQYMAFQQNTALIMPKNFCSNMTFLIIAVCTDLNNFLERQTIRETWGNTTHFNYDKFAKLHSHLNGHYLSVTASRLQVYSNYLRGDKESLTVAVRVIFIIGRSKYESHLSNETLLRLHDEADLHNDIIQENFIDTYNNLTIKSVMALKHIAKSCAKTCAYFLKCDDDTFVNVPNLLHLLLGGTIPLYNDTIDYHDRSSFMVMSSHNRLNATSGIMLGHQFCNVVPVSDINSKWYMPYYMYQGEAYPQYLSGAGYLMSIDVVELLFKAALNTTLMYLEDVYITGLCAERAKIKRNHNSLFSFAQSRHMCAFKGSITQHQVKEESMIEAWRYVSNYSIRCLPPDNYFNHMRLRNRARC